MVKGDRWQSEGDRNTSFERWRGDCKERREATKNTLKDKTWVKDVKRQLVSDKGQQRVIERQREALKSDGEAFKIENIW